MTEYCYLNGKIVAKDKASIGLNNIGILRGYGVFDFLRTYNGKPFLLPEHLSRLKQSAKLLNLKVPVSQTDLKAAIKNLMQKNKLKEAQIRIILTGGATYDTITCTAPTLFILVEKIKMPPTASWKKGVKLITYEHQRELSQAKTINYITAVKMQGQRKKAGALEILYTWRGFVREGTTSNFFIFKNNTLITPKNDILIGTTRNFVINLAKTKFKVQERVVLLKELNSADEAFITATNKEIIPVVKIDKRIVGKGKVGQNTKYLMDSFRESVSRF